MAGVQIVVTNEATNTALTLTTDSAGAYSAVNLIPGSYSITASLPGFSRQVFRNYELQVSQQARFNITMEVGNVEQAVEVQATAPLLQTENASVGQVIFFTGRQCAAVERAKFRSTGDSLPRA